MDLSSSAAVQRKTEEVKDNAKSPVRNPLSEPQPNNPASLKSLELQLMAGDGPSDPESQAQLQSGPCLSDIALASPPG